jgi:2-oxoglutarate dehydrogenase E2 component (dihydrolipoamide succinyltransferase)
VAEPNLEAASEQDVVAPSRRPLSPAVRRLVAEHEIDTGAMRGLGPGDRVTKEDVLAHLTEHGPTAPAAPRAVAPQPVARPPAAPVQAEGEETVPMGRIRRRIAERLVLAQHTAAILTTFNEVDMTAVLALRAEHRERFERTHGVKLGLLSFFARACIAALEELPAVNAEIRGDDIVYKHFVHLGVAVGTERGLVVPVVHHAERLSFAGLEREVARLAQLARTGKLSIEDLSGGTFTISNGGVYGSLLSTPILNPPQSGILGMHKIEKRAVVVDDQVVVRPMMYAALSYDHRLVDGEQAVTFLVRVKERIEDPARLLLEL